MQTIQEIQMSKMRLHCKTNANKKLILVKPYAYTTGSRSKMLPEKKIDELTFHVHKFNNRKKPNDNKKIIFIPAFYEFGVETIGITYCIPQIIHRNPDCYVIIVGWYGRSFLYSKIADEYWELKEEYQWLREYADAFSTESRNLSNLEIKLKQQGKVVCSAMMSKLCVEYYCISCNSFFSTKEHINTVCDKCKSSNLVRPLFGDLEASKKRLWKIPDPSQEKKNYAKSFLKENTVAIFARNRTRYGRNLSINFYVKLINLLKRMGYNPIWMGEKQSVHKCPDPTILDFTTHNESRDLELTLAIISQCVFTIQFYTASTRLASMVKTPWILFESADQLVGNGQEGMRIVLTTDYDKKKIVIANFQNLAENEQTGILYCEQSINEIINKNFETIVGMVDNKPVVEGNMNKLNYWWGKN